MSVESVLSVYGAVLATSIALAQFVTWWRKRVRVEVRTRIVRSSLGGVEPQISRGTAVRVVRHADEFWEEILVGLEVRNKGGTPVQIVAVLVEFVDSGMVTSFQIVPDPLPSVLQPGTRIECSVQKEFLDSASAVTFFGVVDALGRRYAPPKAESIDVIGSSWCLPTRIGQFRSRKDANAPPVSAFPARDRAQMSQSSAPMRPPHPFIVRAETVARGGNGQESSDVNPA
jgi:hypothetical protein